MNILRGLGRFMDGGEEKYLKIHAGLYVVCPYCGKKTLKKKRCMHCWGRLPVEEQGELGGGSTPYWHLGT